MAAAISYIEVVAVTPVDVYVWRWLYRCQQKYMVAYFDLYCGRAGWTSVRVLEETKLTAVRHWFLYRVPLSISKVLPISAAIATYLDLALYLDFRTRPYYRS